MTDDNVMSARSAATGEDDRRWPRTLRSGPLELVAMVLIGVGVVMMCQPFSIALYGWSFLVVLTGTVGFMIVSHFPE